MASEIPALMSNVAVSILHCFAKTYTLLLQTRSGPPVEPMEGSCCGMGCTNCVWLVYANEVIDYYSKFVALSALALVIRETKGEFSSYPTLGCATYFNFACDQDKWPDLV
ncbi:unnamed protein product [Heligmosomoides polygyrus]|uniref:Oxidoreductase-like domain-containing protein n=1 Tax=Heligmosomoides polygyrus TaxID=6339 RepID=A0A183FGN7_HELPZ|nr:unnamed protein product [Heligmosomoides polygyrus]